MSNKFEAAKQIYKGGKYVFETVVPKIAKNLIERFDTKQKAFKSIDEKGKGLSIQKRSEIKKSFSKKVSNIFSEKKAKGGRVGLKKGTGLRKPSNVEKIKKAFGSKKSLGMQSVIYGLDKNPDITKADPKAKFIAAAMKKKKKKKVI